MYALGWLFNQSQVLEEFNICTGQATSVKVAANSFRKVSEQRIEQQIVAARSGDVAALVGNASKAKEILKWQSKRTVEDIATDAWRFYQLLRPQ